VQVSKKKKKKKKKKGRHEKPKPVELFVVPSPEGSSQGGKGRRQVVLVEGSQLGEIRWWREGRRMGGPFVGARENSHTRDLKKRLNRDLAVTNKGGKNQAAKGGREVDIPQDAVSGKKEKVGSFLQGIAIRN